LAPVEDRHASDWVSVNVSFCSWRLSVSVARIARTLPSERDSVIVHEERSDRTL
jgi:hypothetical protein